MDLIRGSIAYYRDQLQRIKPPGIAWPSDDEANQTALLEGLAAEFSRAHGRSIDLLIEGDPRSTRELIAEWEAFAGLPDACSAGIATTLQERRAALVEKLTSRGGQSIAYYLSMALRLGYTIEIRETRPFICGRSRTGRDFLGGAPINRHYWKVKVIGPRITPFRTGVSRCGDRLGKITRAEDLECRLHQLKPAHTGLTVAYEGA